MNFDGVHKALKNMKLPLHTVTPPYASSRWLFGSKLKNTERFHKMLACCSNLHRSPSFWNFPQITSWVGVGNLELYHFDQGAFGHPRTKPTTVLSNLPQLHQFHEVRAEGHQQGPLPRDLTTRMDVSKDWAAWAPGLVAAIRHSLHYVRDDGQKLSKMDMDAWRRHVRQHHTPFRADCRICAEAMGYMILPIVDLGSLQPSTWRWTFVDLSHAQRIRLQVPRVAML